MVSTKKIAVLVAVAALLSLSLVTAPTEARQLQRILGRDPPASQRTRGRSETEQNTESPNDQGSASASASSSASGTETDPEEFVEPVKRCPRLPMGHKLPAKTARPADLRRLRNYFGDHLKVMQRPDLGDKEWMSVEASRLLQDAPNLVMGILLQSEADFLNRAQQKLAGAPASHTALVVSAELLGATEEDRHRVIRTAMENVNAHRKSRFGLVFQKFMDSKFWVLHMIRSGVVLESLDYVLWRAQKMGVVNVVRVLDHVRNDVETRAHVINIVRQRMDTPFETSNVKKFLHVFVLPCCLSCSQMTCGAASTSTDTDADASQEPVTSAAPPPSTDSNVDELHGAHPPVPGHAQFCSEFVANALAEMGIMSPTVLTDAHTLGPATMGSHGRMADRAFAHLDTSYQALSEVYIHWDAPIQDPHKKDKPKRPQQALLSRQGSSSSSNPKSKKAKKRKDDGRGRQEGPPRQVMTL